MPVYVLQIRNEDGDLLGTFGPFTDFEANRHDAEVPDRFSTEIHIVEHDLESFFDLA